MLPRHIKILYVMHVDWDWIKQRPHFLAEQLSLHFDVRVIYAFARNRSLLVKRQGENVRTLPMIRLPFRQRFWLSRTINLILQKIYFQILPL